MTRAIYPGSFDPVTLGHMDVVERAARIFDELLVAVMVNTRKNQTYSFPLDTRMAFLKRCVGHLPNVTVDCSELLLAEYAAQKEATVLVKGLRAVSDFEIEFQMALINRKLNPGLDTLFLTAGERFQYLSSSVVREIGTLGGDIAELVPGAILRDVREGLRHGARG
jgi:pantetheine-phosphate adenylyltransferase